MGRRSAFFHLHIIAAMAAPAAASAADLDPQQPAPPLDVTSSFAIQRSFTSNALDRPQALPDWLNTLRGRVAVSVPAAGGRLRLGIDAEQNAHDRYAVEDDSALRLSLASEHAAGERLTLGAETSFTVASEGDDIAIGDVLLGIRTQTLSGAAALKAAVELNDTLTLSGELAGGVSRPGRAVFEAGLVAPQQLSARRDTLGGGLRLAATAGRATYGGALGAETIFAGRPGEPPYDYRAGRQFARAEAASAWGGFALKAAAGAERLAVAGTPFDVARPALALEAAYTFSGGATLRGAVSAGLDLTGGDDPLGSWVRRVEADAGVPLGTRLALSAGASWLRRENFLLGYAEEGWEAWTGARVALSRNLSLEAQLGASSRRPLVDGAGAIVSLDASLALALALPKEEQSSAR